MILKHLGSLLVFLGCSALGFKSAADLNRERDQLHAFSASLALLRFEIGYRAHTLPEIFISASEGAPEPLSSLFCNLSYLVAQSPEEQLSAHIEASLRSTAGTIPNAICEALKCLGAALGGTDAEAQLHVISLCEDRIHTAEREMQKEIPQRCRVYRTVGICAGALLAILFM